jgi:predicted RNA-binding Zn ribbon-like protein
MSKIETTKPALFELNGGHPALDFVNTLDNRFRPDGPAEMLESYADLLRFLRQANLLSAQRTRLLAGAVTKDAAARALQSARELREAMAATLYSAVDGRAPPAAVIRTLERYFLSASRHRQLRWTHSSKHSPKPWGAHWVWGRGAADVELPLWVLAQAASDLMTSPALDRLRACGSETCRWLFLDTSKNHSRRWCSMRVCGNRMKARRFHARPAT